MLSHQKAQQTSKHTNQLKNENIYLFCRYAFLIPSFVIPWRYNSSAISDLNFWDMLLKLVWQSSAKHIWMPNRSEELNNLYLTICHLYKSEYLFAKLFISAGIQSF